MDFYYRLENKAEKYKVTKWMYDALFTDLDNVSQEDTAIFVKKNKTQNQFLKYKGKIVRNITIVSLDPFGYSVNDTTRKGTSKMEQLGNKYHTNTRTRVIRNILLFKQNEELDPLELSESERLLRLTPYVNDARIYIKTLDRKNRRNDSVDVTVIVHDKWTTLAGSKFNLARPDIQLIEQNIFGIGHQFEEDIEWDSRNSHIGTAGKYSVFNIKNTFISTSVYYSDLYDLSQVGFTVDRPFYSSLTKWAGGIAVSHNQGTYIQHDYETLTDKRYDLDYDIQDIWGGKNFPLHGKKASIGNRTKSFTTGARFFNRDIVKRPSFDIDSTRSNRDQHMYLVNAGWTQRKFYRDRYLYRFGANEDIPEGFMVEYTQGIMQREFSSLWYYSGLRCAAGRQYDFGYLSGGLAYGTFYNRTFIGSGVLSADAFHFTNLIKGGRWFFREFSRVQFVNGIDRPSYENTNLNGLQMYGFSSDQLMNKSKLVLNLEFVMYAPYEVIGFKFAPVVLVGLGKIGGNVNDMFMGSRLYQSYALGVLIRNEHLVTNTFEISIGLYPFMTGHANNTIELNPIGSYALRARDYVIGKPDLIPFNEVPQ
jgi:hypothetical protein